MRNVWRTLLPLLASALYVNSQSLSCDGGPGLYALPDTCTRYYECEQRGKYVIPDIKECPHENRFDDQFGDCRPLSLVTSPPECVQSIKNIQEEEPLDELGQSLSCDGGPGLYALPDTCTRYYECEQRGKYVIPDVKECPHENRFDDQFGDCRPLSLVTSPPECVQSIKNIQEEEPLDELGTDMDDISNKIEFDEEIQPIISDEEETVEGMDTNNTKILCDNGECNSTVNETDFVVVTEEPVTESPKITLCDHMHVIDRYSTLIVSTPFLHEAFEHQKQYNKNVMKYNTKLDLAKNNTYIWRSGDSISNGIKRAFQKADEFKTEFNRKFNINKQLIENLEAKVTDPNHDQKLEQEIKSLQVEIEETKQALAVTHVAGVRQYFENLITSKQQEIEGKMLQKGSHTKVARELDERIHFLEYARDDANEAKTSASTWQVQLEPIMSNLRDDLNAFVTFSDRNNESLNILTDEKERLDLSLTENVNEQDRLETNKLLINNELEFLNSRNLENNKNIYRLTEVIANKTAKYTEKMDAICIIGGPLMGDTTYMTRAQKIKKCKRILTSKNIVLDVSKENKEIKKLNQDNDNISNLISVKVNQLQQISKLTSELFGEVPQYQTRIREIEHELSSLKLHATELQSLEEGVRAALNSIDEIKVELNELIDLFDYILLRFEADINAGKAAQNEDERRNLNKIIEQNNTEFISELALLDFTGLLNCSSFIPV